VETKIILTIVGIVICSLIVGGLAMIVVLLQDIKIQQDVQEILRGVEEDRKKERKP
jgi:hypothetical protein